MDVSLLLRIENFKIINANLKAEYNEQLLKNKRFRPEEPIKAKTYAFLNLPKPKPDETREAPKVLLPGRIHTSMITVLDSEATRFNFTRR